MKWIVFGIVMLMFAAAAVEASPPSQQPVRRLDTGTIVIQDANWKWGDDNRLVVTNGQDLDAVIALTQGNSQMFAAYVRAGESYTLNSIWHSTFTLSFTLGEDWDSNTTTFTRRVQRDRFDQPLVFERNVVPRGGIQFTFWKAYLGSGRPEDPKTLEILGGTRPFPRMIARCPNQIITITGDGEGCLDGE